MDVASPLRPPHADGLRTRLRTETAPAHARVEAAADLRALERSPAAYARFLTVLHTVYGPLEQRLESFAGWDELGLRLEPRRKAPLLAADLAALPSSATAGTVDLDLPLPESFGESLGALYVLEGSTLGARVIARRLAAAPRPLPTRFVQAYGPRTGAMWRAFLHALHRHEARGGDGDEVVRGAEGAFAGLERAFAAQRRVA